MIISENVLDKNLEEVEFADVASKAAFTKDGFRVSVGHWDINLLDARNAQKRGTACPQWTIFHSKAFFVGRSGMGKDLMEAVKVGSLFSRFFKCENQVFDVCPGYLMSKDVWRPGVVIPRLKKFPKRWNITSVIRALHNGQCKKCTIDYRDGGDMGRDVVNQPFHPAEFAKEIIEDRLSWRVRENQGYVTFSVSFDQRSFEFDLNGGIEKAA